MITEIETAVETVPSTLSAMDIKALRQCDRAAFSHHGKNDGKIRCIKLNSKKGPFEPIDVEYDIECRSDVRDYVTVQRGNDFESECRPWGTEYKCFELAYNYIHSPSEYATFAAFLRAGDIIQLQWNGSTNGYSRAAHLHLDSLSVIVCRGDKKHLFLLRTQCCPNNSARMIQVR